MKNEDLNREFSSLLADVAERLKFLSELGVYQIDVKMSASRQIAEHRLEKTHFDNISESPPEKYIPNADLLKSAVRESRKPQTPKSRKSRNLFESAKLSEKKTAPPPDFPLATNPLETKIEQIMPEKSNLKDSLYGDISEALPQTGETLETVRLEIGTDCSRCRLCKDRTQVVNSVGNPKAELMFIGEAPGADEDEQGEPFVGRAGKLLTKIIEAIDFKREDVFIGNINRCRPPENRKPQADEAEVCKPFLLREISIVRPKVIVVMGNTACQNLLDTRIGISKLRGSFKDYFGVKVMPTFHPAYLLRDPRKKREVWDDMKLVKAYLDTSG